MPKKKKTKKKNNQKTIKATAITKQDLETLLKDTKPSRVKKNEYLYEDAEQQVEEKMDVSLEQEAEKNTEEKKESLKKDLEELEISQEKVLESEVTEEKNLEDEIKEEEREPKEQKEETVEDTHFDLEDLKDDEMDLTFISKRKAKKISKKKNDEKIMKDPKKENFEGLEEKEEKIYEPVKVSKSSKKIVIFLILVILLLSGFLAYHFVTFDHSEPRVETKIEEVVPENIVFLGDSITDFYDLDKYYEGYHVVNSGINGNQTDDILGDMNERIYQYNPSKVFILIGTNDLQHEKSVDEIIDNIKKIVEGIEENRPQTQIYIESIYPINNTDNEKIDQDMVGRRTNEDIKEINDKLESYCKEKNITYIDLYNLLVDDEDNLKEEYTNEGLHISDEGYEVITEKIKEYL